MLEEKRNRRYLHSLYLSRNRRSGQISKTNDNCLIATQNAEIKAQLPFTQEREGTELPPLLSFPLILNVNITLPNIHNSPLAIATFVGKRWVPTEKKTDLPRVCNYL